MRHIISAALNHRKISAKEVNLALIVVDEERDHVLRADEAQELRLFVGGQRDEGEVVLVDYLDCVDYFGIYVEVDEVRFGEVAVAELGVVILNFEPLLNADAIKEL